MTLCLLTGAEEATADFATCPLSVGEAVGVGLALGRTEDVAKAAKTHAAPEGSLTEGGNNQQYLLFVHMISYYV